MKLKNLIFYFPNFSEGGVERTSMRLLNHLSKKKIKINFISYKKPKFTNLLKKKNIKYMFKKDVYSNWIFKNYFCLISLYKILVRCKREETVVFALSNLHLCILFSKILGFKVVSRNSAPIDYFKYNPILADYIKLFIKCLIYPLSDLIISNSKSSAFKLKKKLLFNAKIISLPNPLENPNNKKFKYSSKNFLYIGRLSKEKGIYQLIKGFEIFIKKNNNNFKLIIVGDGSQKHMIEKYLKARKLNDKVIMRKWTHNTRKHYIDAKLFILPSFFEGFGNVLIEALSYGLPCLSTNTDGPKEILENGKFGLLIKNNHPKTISKGLVKIIKNYKVFYYKAKLGYEQNLKYDINNIGHLYLKHINSVLN
tara:strand:- start:1506 stop:2603 length:1098 start_codon:yes stop_codon:yes gene_type:complete